MKPRRIWLTAAVALALIWTAVAVVMHQTDSLVSWPEKVIQLVEEAPWLNGGTSSPAARQAHVNQVITNLNRLDGPHRRRLREDGQESVDKFFASLTEEEQKEYVNRTVEPYFDTLDRALKLMPEDERKRVVARMRNDMKGLRATSKDEDRLANQDREFMEMMITEDPVLFLREAPIKVKMELAPVLEEMMTRVQAVRR